MYILINGITLFLVAFITHVLWWRFLTPQNHTRKLFLLFLFYSFVFIFNYKNEYEIIEISYIFIVYFTLAASYILSYTAIESESPTFLILNCIYSSKENGVALEDLRKIITDDKFVTSKISGLLNDKLITVDSGVYKITDAGKVALKPFVFLRKLFGIKKVGA